LVKHVSISLALFAVLVLEAAAGVVERKTPLADWRLLEQNRVFVRRQLRLVSRRNY